MENSGEGSAGCVVHVDVHDVHDSVFVCILPVIFKGRLPFTFFVLQVVLLITACARFLRTLRILRSS